MFKISIGGKTEMFTVDRLKPHLGTAPLQVATPPVRGRPAKRAASGIAAPSGVGSEGGHVETERRRILICVFSRRKSGRLLFSSNCCDWSCTANKIRADYYCVQSLQWEEIERKVRG